MLALPAACSKKKADEGESAGQQAKPAVGETATDPAAAPAATDPATAPTAADPATAPAPTDPATAPAATPPATAEPAASAPAASDPAAAPAAASGATGRRVEIKVEDKGYSPSSVPAKAGEDLILVFLRTSHSDCVNQVIVDNKTVDLPLNKPVEIATKMPTTGDLVFTCGMKMFEGRVVVAN